MRLELEDGNVLVSLEGCELGIFEGCNDGGVLGMTLGTKDGDALGSLEGRKLGIELGICTWLTRRKEAWYRARHL